ncbi:hypothetical protein FHX03_004281 [Rhizobium sp. BK456]|nr:hypothetical protein [Rhizobium sp. BK456]
MIFVARRHVNRLASRASPRPKLAKARKTGSGNREVFRWRSPRSRFSQARQFFRAYGRDMTIVVAEVSVEQGGLRRHPACAPNGASGRCPLP